jgi:serine/threonine protein kinase
MSQDQPNHTGHVLAGRYEIIDEIGRGGFGMVYRARQVNMDREVAVKVLPPQFMAIEDVVARFKREAHLSSRLKHPNTITIHDYGQADNLLFIVMELLDGEDLADVLKRERTLEQQRILHIARQVLKSLAEAHEQGIVHRDLKPENIYLTRVGEDTDFVKVLDFGIAKLAEPGGGETSGRRLTVTGSTVGTPVYMSPEQAAGEEVDNLTDLYALGVIMYEMATGHPPFNDPNPVKIMRAHLFTEVPPFPESCALAGTQLERVVMHALHKDKPLRIQSAAEFLRALDASEPQITALPASLFSLTPKPHATSGAALGAEITEEPPTLEWYDDPPSEDSIEISREDTSTFDRITRRHDTSENEVVPDTSPDRRSDAVPFGAFPSKQAPREPVRESAVSASNEISALSMLADQQISLASALLPNGVEEDPQDLPPPRLNQRELGSVSSIITVVELPPTDDEVILLTQPKTTPANLDLGKGGEAPAGNMFVLDDEQIVPETPMAGLSRLSGLDRTTSSADEITPGEVPSHMASDTLPPSPHAYDDSAPTSAEILLPKANTPQQPPNPNLAPPDQDPSAEWSWDPKKSKELVRDVESGAFPQLQDKKKRAIEKKKEKRSGFSLGVVLFFLICLAGGAVGALFAMGIIKLP